MKKILIFVALLTVFASAVAFANNAKASKPFHEDLTCVECHGEENPTVAKSFLCADCHGNLEDMAKITEKKDRGNPHKPPHWEYTMPCEECHKEHKASYNYCTEGCHDWTDMKIK